MVRVSVTLEVDDPLSSESESESDDEPDPELLLELDDELD